MNLWQTLRGGPTGSEERDGSAIGGPDAFAELLNAFSHNGLVYGGGIHQTLANNPTERISGDYASLVAGGYAANGVVFSCMLVRQLVFSAVRFQWQQLRAGRPSDMYGNQSLNLLEEPWSGGTTQDLLSRMIQDADLAGNAYWTVDGGEMVRLRPDWVEIVLEPRIIRGGVVGFRRAGYLYYEGGLVGEKDPVPFRLADVAHFAPLPDPSASWRGMSWLTPVVREIQADAVMTRHRRRFFENGATPNMVIKHPPEAKPEAVQKFKAAMDAGHRGVDNAYKTLHVGGGADVTVVGKDFQQIDFRQVQGAGETRIAAAAGVPPVIVGLSEGLAAATYSNYGQARRRFADGTIHPLWQNVAGSLARVMPRQAPGTRLWYDARDVPFLREDEKDAAEIQSIQVGAISGLVTAGFTPESAKAAVIAQDFGLLVHSGLVSVQLLPPGTEAGAQPAAESNGSGPKPRKLVPARANPQP